MESHSHPSNAEANRIFWDGAVDSFYESFLELATTIQLYRQVTETVLTRFKFNPETTVLMDFACGNGALSVALAPHCKAIVGVDISQGMVDAYNKRMQGHGIARARAVRAELEPNESKLAGQKFDVILCSQSYKHIDNNVAITRVLKSFLKPNGALLVVDVIRGKDAFGALLDMKSHVVQSMMTIPRPKNIMSHMGGYAEDDMRTIFEEAGLVDFTFEEAFVKEENGKSFGLFLAKGISPPLKS